MTLAGAISRLLQERGAGELEEGLTALEAEHGAEVYAELLFVLTHLRFDPPAARDHWERIRELRETMESRLSTPVDVRVALVNYFVGVHRQLRSPKVIELRLFEETEASAFRDGLTGLYNFRYFEEHFAREIQRARRYTSHVSLLMIDVDDFKRFNDRHGHATGNEALAAVAEIVQASLRGVDTVSRYGGEEFAVVLPATEKRSALVVANRIREAVEARANPVEDAPTPLTVSIGVAAFPADAREADSVIRAADSALYVAKSRGKNRVHLHGDDRRSHRRISATLDGQYCLLAAEAHSLTTRNVSEGGLLFYADESLPPGALLEVRLDLGPDAKPIVCTGRVIRVEEQEDGRFEAAFRIVQIDPEHRRILDEYLRDET